MIRNLKALGLALFAVFAMSAVAASAASAQNGMLTSNGPVTLIATETGVEANKLTAFGTSTECPDSTFTGHKYLLPSETTHEEITTGIHQQLIPSGATTTTITTHYKEREGAGITPAAGAPNCKVPGLGWTFTIDMNGCDYVFHLGATTGVADTYAVTVDIVCPLGKEITVTIWTTEARHTASPNAPDCIEHFPSQNGLVGATAKDTTNGYIDLVGTITGIRATRTGTGDAPLLCPVGPTESINTKYDLDLTVEGKNAGGEKTNISITHN